MYLFKRASDGVTIFGENSDSICKSQFWVEPTSGNKVQLRNLDGTIFRYEFDITTVKKNANGDLYTNLAEFLAISSTLFGGSSDYPSGKPTKLTLSFSRPADVLDYAANDAVGPVTTNAVALEFTGDAAFLNGGGGTISFLKIEAPAKFAGKKMAFYIYNDQPSSLVGDNVPFVLDTANRLKRVAKIELTMDAVENSSTIVWGQTEAFIQYQCISTSKKLYCALKVCEAITAPESAGLFTVSLTTNIQA